MMTMRIFAALSVLLLLSALSPVQVDAGDAGILYEVWHGSAAQGMKKVKEMGGRQLTVEQVIRSNGTFDLDDVYGPYNISTDIYNVHPKLGFYCLYRKRANETSKYDDCDNITQTATAHASMLTSAGFDYVVGDVTNWPVYSDNTDFTVLRPIQVLYEEWHALRQQGIRTPQIAVWPCSPVGSNTWQWFLDNIYNVGTYDDLIYKQDGKKVMFVPMNSNCQADNVTQAIASNGGRNDIKVVLMWALFGPVTYTTGTWGFFSPCVSGDDPNRFTTSMVGEPECNQYATLNASGSPVELTASGSYMLSQCALPFAAPGHMRGLTLQRLFKKVLESRLPHLFVSSFNEHIGGRQQPASPAKIAFNQGLPNDSQRSSVWVDTYGAAFSRDLEPSFEAGDVIWQVVSSCVQLYKANKTCADEPDEPCCTTADKEVFANVWSLTAPGGADNLATTDRTEKDDLVKEGWTENCSPIVGPSVFCVDTQEPDGRNGPFIIFNTSLPNTRPLYRCITTGGQHFMSADSACEGSKTESLMGYTSAAPGNDTVRALRRCRSSASTAKAPIFHHALDLECDINDSLVLGYVK